MFTCNYFLKNITNLKTFDYMSLEVALYCICVNKPLTIIETL